MSLFSFCTIYSFENLLVITIIIRKGPIGKSNWMMKFKQRYLWPLPLFGYSYWIVTEYWNSCESLVLHSVTCDLCMTVTCGSEVVVTCGTQATFKNFIENSLWMIVLSCFVHDQNPTQSYVCNKSVISAQSQSELWEWMHSHIF